MIRKCIGRKVLFHALCKLKAFFMSRSPALPPASTLSFCRLWLLYAQH